MFVEVSGFLPQLMLAGVINGKCCGFVFEDLSMKSSCAYIAGSFRVIFAHFGGSRRFSTLLVLCSICTDAHIARTFLRSSLV